MKRSSLGRAAALLALAACQKPAAVSECHCADAGAADPHLRGRIVAAPDHDALAFAKLNVTPRGTASVGYSSWPTKTDGGFEFPHVTTGTWMLRLDGASELHVREVTEFASPVRWELGDEVRFEPRVVQRNHTPSVAYDVFKGGLPFAHFRNGLFLAPGDYALEVVFEPESSDPSCQRFPFTISRGAPGEFEFTERPRWTLRGKLLTADGKPAAREALVVAPVDDNACEQRRVLTTNDGSFEVRGITFDRGTIKHTLTQWELNAAPHSEQRALRLP